MALNKAKQTNWLRLIRTNASLQWAMIILAWLLVWQLGLLVEYTAHASVWFPAAGLTYAALLVMGPRAVGPLMISCILITLLAGNYYDLQLGVVELLVAGALFGIAHITPYYLGSYVVRWLSNSDKLSLPQLIIAFLVSSAIFSLVATFLVIGVLVATSMMNADAVSSTWLPFWIGDLAGIIVMAPLFVGLMRLVVPDSEFKLNEHLKTNQFIATSDLKYKLGLIAAMITAAMLLAKYTGSSESAFAIFFLAVPHMWIACTETAFYNSLCLAFSSFLIALLVNVLGLMDFVMVYQFAVNVVAANALFGIAVPALMSDNLKLRKQVLTDTLTNAASREHLVQRAEHEISRCKYDLSPLTLVVFDIDHFKLINDEHGHAAGDQALRIVSGVAAQCLRPSDMLGRFGGDEFVVLLPQTTIDSGVTIANRIRSEIDSLKLEGINVTSSFGVSALQENDNFSALFKRADDAMYEAKRAGRNRVLTENNLNLGNV